MQLPTQNMYYQKRSFCVICLVLRLIEFRKGGLRPIYLTTRIYLSKVQKQGSLVIYSRESISIVVARTTTSSIETKREVKTLR